MDRDQTYSLISVNADGDEEVVIQTGVSRQAAGSDLEPAREREQGAVAVSDGREDDADAAVERAAVADVEERPAEAARKPRSSQPRYRETTQEDLDSVEPMSKMQKIVIACVFLLIVGFVVYYLFFR